MSNVANTIGPQHQLAINGLDKIKQSAKSRLQNNLLFAGNVTPKEAWFLLQEDDHSVLCDVRTSAEWNFVGVPDLSTLNKEPILLSWQIFPGMEVNSDFINDFEKIQNYYEKLRLGRVHSIQTASEKQAFYNHVSNPILVKVRNFLLKNTNIALRRTKNIYNYNALNELNKII